jgi:hypothetical protein
LQAEAQHIAFDDEIEGYAEVLNHLGREIDSARRE